MANSDARDIIDSVQQLAGPAPVEPDGHYVVVTSEGMRPHRLAPVDEEHLAAPRRVRGRTRAYDVDAFSTLWAKHAEGGAELFGDPLSHTFVGVLNADTGAGGAAGFRDHRVELPLRATPAWKAWREKDGLWLDQTAFAEFIEDRIIDVVRPTGADMLELASTLESKSSVDFKSSVSLSSGARTLSFDETIASKAGQSGTMEIPKDIELGIAPFESGDSFRITARFRFRIRGGSLSLGIVLDRPEDVEKAAFEDFVEKVGQACDQTVLLGTPPGPTLS